MSIRMMGLMSNIPMFGMMRRIGSRIWFINPSTHRRSGKSGGTNQDITQYNNSSDVVALIKRERNIRRKPIYPPDREKREGSGLLRRHRSLTTTYYYNFSDRPERCRCARWWHPPQPRPDNPNWCPWKAASGSLRNSDSDIPRSCGYAQRISG